MTVTPDKQEDGRFATTEEYDNWTGIPVLKSTLTAGYVEKDGKWVVDTEHGYQDNNDDGMVDREANGEFSCNRNYKNYNGKLITKAEWDALSEEEKNPPKEEAPAIPTEVRDLLDNLAIVAKRRTIENFAQRHGIQTRQGTRKEQRIPFRNSYP